MDAAVLDRLDRRLCQRPRPYKPLVGQVWLDHGLRAIPSRYHQRMLVNLFDEFEGFKVSDDSFSGDIAIEAVIG